MKNRRNYYRILHVQPDAPLEVIRSSYRTIMQKLRAHPDLGGDEWNAALINEAYAVMTEAEKRAAYDATLQHATIHLGSERSDSGRQPEASPAPSDFSSGQVRCTFCDALQQRTGVYRVEDHCVRCNSPLVPVVPLMLENTCKRAIARVATHSDVEFFSRWPQTPPHRGAIVDLSLNGIGIHASLVLSIGTVIKLDSFLLSATARVVNCLSPYGKRGRVHQLGAEFLTLEFNELYGTFVSART